MKPSEALEKHRESIRAAVLANRSANPRVFGSVARNEDTEESDLDLLVDTLPGTTLLDLGGLQVHLEELLGVKVDVVTSTELPWRYRKRILADARPV